jgi:phosphodiesterase/alkaline phosphatase D-like protein
MSRKNRSVRLLLEALEDRLTPSVSFLGVGAGDASDSDAILWTRAQNGTSTAGVPLRALVSTDPGFGSGQFYAATTDPAHDFTVHVDATGLQSGTRYYYEFLADDGTLSPVGTFTTAPAATANVPVHFGFSGDGDGQWRPYGSTADATAPGVPSFAQQNFDYFVWLGDTIYETASSVSPATADPFANPAQALQDYRRKYREQLQPVNPGGFPGLQTFFDSTGHYTLLDNHETGNKQFQSGGAPAGSPPGAGVDASNPAFDVNTTGTWINRTPGFQVLEEAYTDYQPIRLQTVHAPGDPRSDGTQQLYFAQQWGANSIFFNLDDRSYRDIRIKTAAGADDTGPRADNPGRTMLGATQLQWAEQGLLDAQARGVTWKIVAVSSPIDQIGPIGGSFTIHNADGTYSNVESDGGKSWMGGYRSERDQLLQFIADNHIDHVVFLTTDDHQVRINELGYFTQFDANGTPIQSSYTRVPGCFQVLVGPIGAGGPDGITNHSFANILSLAESFASQQQADGVDPIGLAPDFPGLQNVYREGDPNADALRRPVDFYSPDTFNYASLDVSPDGQTLTVKVYGLNSYAANTFPEPSAANPVRLILSFQIGLEPTALSSVAGTGTYGGTATLTATLTDTATAAPLAGKVVTFALGGQVVGTATTDDTGTAMLAGIDLTGYDAGTYPGEVTASFAGDAADLPASGSGTLTVERAPLVVTPNDATKVYGQTFTDFSGTVEGLKNDDPITVTYSSRGSPANAPVSGSPYAIRATLHDPMGRLGNYAVTLNVGRLTVQHIALEPDPVTPGQTALFVGGTPGDDRIDIEARGGGLEVSIRGRGLRLEQTVTADVSRLVVFGAEGNDTITVGQNVLVPAFLFGGAGDDRIEAGGGPTVAVGGGGDDDLRGGRGASILIAGAGHDRLQAGAGGSILIAGTTAFDSNLAALDALLAEWARTDETYAEKVAHLDGAAAGGANGAFVLDSSTVHSAFGRDDLRGGPGLDWYFAHLSGRRRDRLHGVQSGEVVTEI